MTPGISKSQTTARQQEVGSAVTPKTPGYTDLPSRISALSDAGSRAGRLTSTPPRRRPLISSPTILVLVPLLAGIAGGFLAHKTIRCTATFRLSQTSDAEQGDRHRRELLDFIWSRSERQANADAPLPRVDQPQPEALRITLTTADADAGILRVRSLAEGFLAHLRRQAVQQADHPTAAEGLLSDLAERLTRRLRDAQTHLNESLALLPADDPALKRQDLMQRWLALRNGFDGARERLRTAAETFADLQSAPGPEHGLVTSVQRRQAIESDAALQHDLAQLTVELSRLKLHLLNIWQRSAGPLDKLKMSTGEWGQLVARSGDQAIGTEFAEDLDALSAVTARYQSDLATFSQEWTGIFTALQHVEIDAYTGDLVDQYERSRRRLNDFLFTSARHLTAMRAHLGNIGNRTNDNARSHVLRSNLVRSFQRVQTGHHRFEFAVASIETPENFRLDAAMKSARGIRRRTRERLEQIESRLQTDALKHARKSHGRLLDESKHLLTRARDDLHRTAEEIVQLQERINRRADENDALRNSLRSVDAGTNRIEHLQLLLGEIEDRRAALEHERHWAANDLGVDLIGCDAVLLPVPPSRRLRLGSLVGVIALVTLLLLHRLTPGRSDRRFFPRPDHSAS